VQAGLLDQRVPRVFDSDHRPGFSLTERPRGWDELLAVTDYQPLWPLRYAIEARVLRESLLDLEPAIEHVGSTAVPATPARPIIDIALGLRSTARVAEIEERLQNIGYLPASSTPACDRLFVRRVRGVRTHQVLLVDAGGGRWRALLAFCDRLRADGALAARYAQLKGDGGALDATGCLAYRAAKWAFIESVLAGADLASAA